MPMTYTLRIRLTIKNKRNEKKFKKNRLPSNSSKLAPPPVLTILTLSSVPYLAAQVAVSPPPIPPHPKKQKA